MCAASRHALPHTPGEATSTSLSSLRTPSAKHSFDLLSEPCDHAREMLGAGFRGAQGVHWSSGVRAGLQLGVWKILFLPFQKHKEGFISKGS